MKIRYLGDYVCISRLVTLTLRYTDSTDSRRYIVLYVVYIYRGAPEWKRGDPQFKLFPPFDPDFIATPPKPHYVKSYRSGINKRMIKVSIEQPRYHDGNKDQPGYYSFWVREWLPGTRYWHTTSGWRYYPTKGTVSTPSINKGGKWHNTHKMDESVYNLILDEAVRMFGTEELQRAA